MTRHPIARGLTAAEAVETIRELADEHALPVIIWQRGDIRAEAQEKGFRDEDTERIADHVADSRHWSAGVVDAGIEAGWEPIYQGIVEAAADLNLTPVDEESD